MLKEADSVYIKELKNGITEFIVERINSQIDEDYKQKERKLLLYIKEYIEDTESEVNDEDIYILLNEFILFFEQNAYQIGFQDGCIMAKQNTK